MPSSRLSSVPSEQYPPAADSLESSLLDMAKKIVVLVLGICYLLFGTSLAYADSRPYFRANGADVLAGGWFNSGVNSCNPADANTFQAPNYSPLSNIYKGGILTYANRNGGGAGSQFGALALGLIEGNNGNEPLYGFTSGSGGYNKLSFANLSSLSATDFWGGFWEGSGPHQASHCLPDYYGTKQSSASSWSRGDYSAKGEFTTSAGDLAGGTVGADANLALFIHGNVHITSSIIYGPHDATNIPKFVLVVQGNIFIDSSVAQLDGWYIAQPDPGATTSGTIWTCHDGNPGVPLYSDVRDKCGSKLTINGSLSAKQVAFLRVLGDIADSSNTAEVINYTPEMVIGGGFFNGGTTGKYKIESLISLPPVF